MNDHIPTDVTTAKLLFQLIAAFEERFAPQRFEALLPETQPEPHTMQWVMPGPDFRFEVTPHAWGLVHLSVEVFYRELLSTRKIWTFSVEARTPIPDLATRAARVLHWLGPATRYEPHPQGP